MAIGTLGLIAAAVGVGGAAGAAGGGIGRNGTNVTDFGRTSQYDPNKFQYGGWDGGATEAATRYANQAGAAQGRGAAQADYGQANNYGGLANAWNDQSFQARQAQGNVAGLMYNRATGAVPSIAGQQAAADQAALQRQAAEQSRSAQAQQMAAAASARGPAGLALAQQGAANNIANSNGAIGAASANAMQGISQQAQVNAAQERMQAEQGAMGAYSGMRQGDQSSQGLAQGMQGQLAQQAQYQASLQQQQHGLNDQMTLGMTQAEQNVQRDQLNASLQQQGLLANSFQQSQALRSGINQQNADNSWKYIQMGLGAAEGGLSGGLGGLGGGGAGGAGGGGAGMEGAQMASITGGGPVTGTQLQMTRAHGGPVSAGRPYLVGERGPELIVPSHSGYVIPNHALAGAGLLSDDRAKLRAAFNSGFDRGSYVATKYPDPNRPVVGGEIPEYMQDKPRQIQSFQRMDRASMPAEREKRYNAAVDLGSKLQTNPVGLLAAGPAAPLAGAGIHMLAGGTKALGGLLPESLSYGPPKAQAQLDREAEAERPQYIQQPAIARDPFREGAAKYGIEPAGTDPTTAQLGAGLAPIAYEYKPGMGPAGVRPGVRAQMALTQPITAPMITQRPDGLLQIDQQQGLGTALAGVGHLAKKVADHDRELRRRREGAR